MPSELEALIERLEKAEAPTRQLFLQAWDCCFKLLPGDEPDPRADRFVELLDVEAWEQAALTLVPEGFSWHCYAHPAVGETEPEPRSYADVYQLAPTCEGGNPLKRKLLSGPHTADAPTPALAIVGAALRARSATP